MKKVSPITWVFGLVAVAALAVSIVNAVQLSRLNDWNNFMLETLVPANSKTALTVMELADCQAGDQAACERLEDAKNDLRDLNNK